MQIVTVEDTTPPEAVCMDITITLDKFGLASIVPADLDGGSTDNCAAPNVLTMVASQTDFDCTDLGPNNITLIVSDPCGNTSSCVAIVTVEEGIGVCDPAYDPNGSAHAICLDNATTLENGQFVDTIQIWALAGQTWTVQSASGIYLTSSSAPPATPDPILPGFMLTPGHLDGVDNDGNGLIDEMEEMIYYRLIGLHVDGEGYALTLTNDLGQTVSITNTAYYPTPLFTNLDGPFCLSTPSFAVEMIDQFGSAGTITNVLINGVSTNIFDAASLGIGFHTVQATFDAGLAASNLIVDGQLLGVTDAEALADAGCQQTISTLVEVVGTPTVVACNDLVQIAIEDDCQVEITPDMVLEGSYLCYDDYQVVISYPFGTNTFNPANMVDGSHVNMTLTYTLMHDISGNVCWGELEIVDLLPPVVTCPPTVQIFCTQDEDDTSITGEPTVEDCSSYNLEFIDDFEQFDCDQNPEIISIITRTWIITDAYNNETECDQTIEVLRGSVDQVVFPSDHEYSCNALPGILEPINTGWPTLGGQNITSAGTGACGLSVNYVDEVANICEGSYKIIRTWTINDWCPPVGGATTLSYVQDIKVNDVAPTISLPSDSYDPVNDWYVLNANGYADAPYFACASNGPLPMATITDACNSILEIEVATPEGTTTNGGPVPAPGLIEGLHTITYLAEDACGNVSELTVQVYVEDQVAPIAICDEITEVDLTNDGLATVPAGVFNDGSYDNCCLSHFEVRRMDGDCNGLPDDFGPTVEFCCADVGGDPVMVVFRVYDCTGNYNECMVQVNVDDKIPPVVIDCPATTSVTCDLYYAEWASDFAQGDFSALDVYGEPIFLDNCSDNVTYDVTADVNSCGKGVINRTWTLGAGSSTPATSCTQTIIVNHLSDWAVEFPADITHDCENGSLPDFGEPNVFYDNCELMATSFEDQYFFVVPDACYKIVRTWTVINWCLFEDYGSNVFSELGYAECDLGIDFDLDGDQDCRTFRDGYNQTGAPGTADGYISYEQSIKVIDTTDPVFALFDQMYCIEGTSCGTQVELPDPDIMDCSSEFSISIATDLPGATSDPRIFEDVPPGVYNAVYTVMDECGNSSSESMLIGVEDCKNPTPYCENGLVLEIGQNGSVEVWASDLDAGSFDNCPGNLTFSFSDDPTNQSANYTCDDLGVIEVQMWVTDGFGNQDFCETFFVLQDNLNSCDTTLPNVAIAGQLQTEAGEPMDNIEVDINMGLATLNTDPLGYFYVEVPAGGDYTVSPYHNEDVDNGVTTFDIVLLTQHILGVNPITNPYRLIAGDANNTGTITTLDVVAIRRVILQLDDEFPNNTSWRFVPQNFDFPVPADPWASSFPEVLNYNNLLVAEEETHFYGIKVGDLNGSATVNAMQSGEQRSGETPKTLKIFDQVLLPETVVDIPIYLSESGLLGLQGTLQWDSDKINIMEVLPGLATQGQWAIHTNMEALAFSWEAPLGSYQVEDEPLFTLRLQVLQAENLISTLQMNDLITTAEVYTPQSAPHDLAIDWHSELANWALLGNVPNPFTRQTTIKGFAAQDGQVTLRVVDARGQEVWQGKRFLPVGPFEWILSGKELEEPGVYFYQLITQNQTLTQKMVYTK